MGTKNQSSTVFFPEKTLSMYPPNGFTMTVTIARNSPYWTILSRSMALPVSKPVPLLRALQEKAIDPVFSRAPDQVRLD
jgi:hypothetical protein